MLARRSRLGQLLGHIGALRRERLLDLVQRPAGRLRQLGGGRLAAQAMPEMLRGHGQRARQLLKRARHPDGPAAIAEQVHDLAFDRPRGIRLQRNAALGLVAIDGLDQAEVAALKDVVICQAASRESARDRPG